MTERQPPPDTPPPVQLITMNQLVAYNMGVFRRAAGLTQEELGARLGGWSAASVSAAERSWDGKRVKKFDADELVSIATALSVPVVALFLPPEDDDVAVRYLVRASEGGPVLETASFMRLIIPDSRDETTVMTTYRDRWNAALMRLFGEEPEWDIVARWLADTDVGREEYARRLRERRRELLRTADELGDLADAIEGRGDRARDPGEQGAETEAERARRLTNLAFPEPIHGIIPNSQWQQLTDKDRGVAIAAARDLAERDISGPYVVQRQDEGFTVLPEDWVLEAIREEAEREGQRLQAMPLQGPTDPKAAARQVPGTAEAGARGVVLPLRRAARPR